MKRQYIKIVAVCSIVTACSDIGGKQQLPSGTADPGTYATAKGAREMRNSAIYMFEGALPTFIAESGLLTDELSDRQIGASAGVLLQSHGLQDPLDERIMPERSAVTVDSHDRNGYASYTQLQNVREFASQAIGALAAYDTIPADSVSAQVLRGELYAIEGFTEIMLADLFCSGVPLSTLDFEHDYTLRASSTTAQVYQDAIAKFDTALVLTKANDTITNLARVGRGRAWLNLGRYDSAAVAIQAVPISFQYQLAGLWYGGASCRVDCANQQNTLLTQATVSDREGLNGLPYISSNDPRSAVVPATLEGVAEQFPQKYQSSLTGGASAPIVVADGIEAQLILAETQLQPASAPSGPWLHTLNVLRASAGLADTTDPGTAAGRIQLLFSERAYWLFLTGHRQGDLRRLLRTYGPTNPEFRQQSVVYPTGAYTAPGTGVYGTAVVAPIPPEERTNSLYHGCLNFAP